jgi:hypothetical protein
MHARGARGANKVKNKKTKASLPYRRVACLGLFEVYQYLLSDAPFSAPLSEYLAR